MNIRKKTAKVAQVRHKTMVRVTYTPRVVGLAKFAATPAGGAPAGASRRIRSRSGEGVAVVDAIFMVL